MVIWPGQSSERPSGALDSVVSRQAATAVASARMPVAANAQWNEVCSTTAPDSSGAMRAPRDSAVVQEARPRARAAGVGVPAMITAREAGKRAAAPMPDSAWPVISCAAESAVAETR